jgi:thiosulfate/3-mercaptopyruvate sulfurtransferase
MLSHHHFPRTLTLIAALMFIAAVGSAEPQTAQQVTKKMDTLVSTEWLSQHLDDPDLVVLDCTIQMQLAEGGGFKPVSGRADYEEGHIPSAGFADLMGDLVDSGGPLKYALPTPEHFCNAMGALGVGDDSFVVLYDGNNAVWASRIWWMLRWVGFDQAAVLDGGLKAWTAEERPLSAEPASFEAKELTPHPRPELIADRDEVFAAIKDDSVTLIDSMPELHYQGKMALYERPGHIPTAINISALSLLDESGHFKSQEELAALFDLDRKERVITYCGGGIAASADAFIMTRLGFTDVAVYAASLQEWAADPNNPLEVEGP